MDVVDEQDARRAAAGERVDDRGDGIARALGAGEDTEWNPRCQRTTAQDGGAPAANGERFADGAECVRLADAGRPRDEHGTTVLDQGAQLGGQIHGASRSVANGDTTTMAQVSAPPYRRGMLSFCARRNGSRAVATGAERRGVA